MIRPVVSGKAVLSSVMLIGQAPGAKEGVFGKPFAWTAGKTMFRWFDSIGMNEEEFRSRIYMAAVCRCFPGKNPKGGDRVPEPSEIERCSAWLMEEIRLLKPELIIPVGKLAIAQLVPYFQSAGLSAKTLKLETVVGKKFRARAAEVDFDVVPLPHPSGASTWHRMEPGMGLLKKSLSTIRKHPAFIAASVDKR